MEQIILSAKENYKEFDEYLKKNKIKNIFVVMGASARKLDFYIHLMKLEEEIFFREFSDFSPNPTIESVMAATTIFNEGEYNLILAIGGGSAMDVAKSVKFYSKTEAKLLAVPTTAGTGSEATPFAVIYEKQEKLSIEDETLLPSVVLFDVKALRTLPTYQRRATSLDTFCHLIESFWSINSNDESRKYSKEGLCLFLKSFRGYIENSEEMNEIALRASYLAGKAIAITKTTAAHALSYKLTTLYGIPHGMAVGISLYWVLDFMLKHKEQCIDSRGIEHFNGVIDEISEIFQTSPTLLQERIGELIFSLVDTSYTESVMGGDMEILVGSVNVDRLKNNPIELKKEDIEKIYKEILRRENET